MHAGPGSHCSAFGDIAVEEIGGNEATSATAEGKVVPYVVDKNRGASGDWTNAPERILLYSSHALFG